MALQARLSRDPPWRSGNNSLRSPQRPPNSHRPLLRRVRPSLHPQPSTKTNQSSQPFWANMVFSAGAGPRPLDGKTLDASTLATAIETLLHPSTIQAANRISDRMRNESGIKSAVRSFHRNLPIREMHCDMVPRQPATWCWKKGKRTLKLSHRAASILVEHKKIEASSLEMSVTFLQVPAEFSADENLFEDIDPSPSQSKTAAGILSQQPHPLSSTAL
jgi:hypothetical protein